MWRRLLLVFILLFVTTGCDPESNQMADLVVAHHPGLQRTGELDQYAHDHARVMFQQQRLFHSQVEHLPGDWSAAAEIVGRGDSVQAVFLAFLASPGHRTVIESQRFTQIGSGQDNGYYVVVFVDH